MLLFVAGFTVVFTLFGAFASTFVRLLRGTTGQLVAGVVVVVMGLVMIGYAFERGSVALYAERRPFLRRARPGVWGAFPLGMAFATGWTPCIGPVLAGILAIAGSQDTARGMLLLVCYSLGLGVPFLLVGFGIQRLLGAFGWVRRNYRWIATGSGLLLRRRFGPRGALSDHVEVVSGGWARISPGAACDAGSRRSPAACRAGGSACTSRKCA